MRALRITAPFEAAILDCPEPSLTPDSVLVRARCTAISVGTEMRQYRDERVAQNPAELPARQWLLDGRRDRGGRRGGGGPDASGSASSS